MLLWEATPGCYFPYLLFGPCTFASMRATYFVFQSSLACLPQILVSTLSHNLFKG